MSNRIWPKTVGEYLIILITFPLWLLMRLIGPDLTDKYFFDHSSKDGKND